jgi:hypothetical protein
VNVADGCHIWAEKYDRRLAAVFQLQEEIAAAIVAALKRKLPRHPAASSRVIDSQAHALCLKGRYWWHRWNPEALRKAAGFFKQAIERDARCAGAYSGVADCLFLQGYYGYGHPREVIPRAGSFCRVLRKIDGAPARNHTAITESKIMHRSEEVFT